MVLKINGNFEELIFKNKPLSIRQIIVVFLLIQSQFLNAAIDSKYKEALQRGYTLDGDSVVFPDGTKCLLTDFNAGYCGLKWKSTDYCIPEGAYVWDDEKCCEGLEAYLPEGVMGQATCQPKEKITDEETGLSTTIVYFLLGLAIVFTAFIVFAVYTKYKK